MIYREAIGDQPFTTFANKLLRDTDLGADALGVLVYLLSMPGNWQIMPGQLAKRFGCGKDKIYRILNDLIVAGYADRRQNRDLNGSYKGQDFIVSNNKLAPLRENPDAANPDLGNPAQLKKDSTKDLKNPSPAKSQEGDGKPPEKRKVEKTVYTEQFENQVWAPYPRKVGTSKKAAFGRFLALSDEDQALVISTIPIYARLKAGKEEQHIHHLEFFLSKRIFETVSISRPATAANPQGYQDFNHRQWEQVLKIWREKREWSANWGPAPGRAGSRVPVELLFSHELGQQPVDSPNGKWHTPATA